MGDKTAIEWTDATWNVLVGCTKVSEGCDHCYAIGVAHRGGFDGIGIDRDDDDKYATTSAADLYVAYKLSAAAADAAKQALFTRRARLDSLRTLSANVRSLT